MARRSLVVMTILASWIARSEAQEEFRSSGDRPVQVQHIKLELEVFLTEKRVAATATLDVEALRPLRTLKLDAVGFETSQVTQGETKTPVSYENTGKELILDFGEQLEIGAKRKITVVYQLRQPQHGLYFFGPSPAEPETPLMVWSQGEPRGNRYWVPCLDNPNERQTTEVVATVPAGFNCVSNGKLVSHETNLPDGKERFHWLQSKPHASYLITLVVGKFALGEDKWREVPLVHYAPPSKAADIARTFGATRDMVDFFSGRFGIDYPWDKYAQVVVEQFSAGGMENTSATTLVESVMHDERSLLASSPEGLISHELGHQWWGDLVTCKDWSHLWLNEGFATYCECLWAEHKQGRDEMQYLLYGKSKMARSGLALTRPIVDRFYTGPDQKFDTRAYPKGGWVLHMLRSRIGDKAFFAGLKRYGTEFGYRSAETSDLRMTMERVTGQPLERFFYDWTERSGHPELEVATSYDAENKLLRVAAAQKQTGAPFHFPLTIEVACVSGSAGKSAPIRLTKDVVEKEAVFYLPLPARPESVRIDPDYTLLAELREEKSHALFEAQLQAPSVPERLRAIEHFRKSKADADRELVEKVLREDPFYGVRVEAALALAEMGGEKRKTALLHGLADREARVRAACAKALGGLKEDSGLIKEVTALLGKGDPSYAVEAALLGALAQLQKEPAVAPLAAALSKPSHNEVVRVAALKGLGYSSDPAALDLLMEWSKRGKPRECRSAALAALGVYWTRNTFSEDRRKKVVETLGEVLTDEKPRLQRAALESIKLIGRPARAVEPQLEALVAPGAEGRLRDLAKEALASLRADTPAPEELQRLRKELDTLRDANRKLDERVHRVERK